MPGGFRSCELERIALIVVPAAQIDAVAFLAALGHPHDVDEELAAFLKFWRQNFDMAKMGNVVDRFGWHGLHSFLSFDQFCRSARANASTRLLAGIGVISVSERPALSASARKIADITHAPFRVLRPQGGIEGGVAWRGMRAVAHEWAIDEQTAV